MVWGVLRDAEFMYGGGEALALSFKKKKESECKVTQENS